MCLALSAPLYLRTLWCYVGWVIWPVKIVPDMTYNVFGGTLNPTLHIYISADMWLWVRNWEWSMSTAYGPIASPSQPTEVTKPRPLLNWCHGLYNKQTVMLRSECSECWACAATCTVVSRYKYRYLHLLHASPHFPHLYSQQAATYCFINSGSLLSSESGGKSGGNDDCQQYLDLNTSHPPCYHNACMVQFITGRQWKCGLA